MMRQREDSHPQTKEEGLEHFLPSQPSKGTHSVYTLILNFDPLEM